MSGWRVVGVGAASDPFAVTVDVGERRPARGPTVDAVARAPAAQVVPRRRLLAAHAYYAA